MNTRYRPLSFTTLLLTSALSYASPWTVTSTGTIKVGTDGMGIFGAIGGDLTGKSVVQSISLDPTWFPTQDTSNNNYIHSQGWLAYGKASVNVIINDISKSYTWDLNTPNWGQSMLSNGISSGANTGFYKDSVISYLQGFATDGLNLTASDSFQSYVIAFNPSLNYSEVLPEYKPPAFALTNSNYGDIYFSYGSTFFDSANGLTSISVNSTISSVPEPSSAALIGVGMIVFTIARRRSPSKRSNDTYPSA